MCLVSNTLGAKLCVSVIWGTNRAKLSLEREMTSANKVGEYSIIAAENCWKGLEKQAFLRHFHKFVPEMAPDNTENYALQEHLGTMLAFGAPTQLPAISSPGPGPVHLQCVFFLFDVILLHAYVILCKCS